MEEQYQILAKALLQTCPPNFSGGEITGQLRDDHGNVMYNCLVGGVEKVGLKPDPSVNFTVYRALKQLRADMTSEGNPPWTTFSFRLHPDGGFKFDVGYDG